MSYEVFDVEQRGEAWLRLKLGIFGASDAPKMLATIKSGEAAARRDLRLRLVCERLTNALSEDVFVNADMERGVALEPQARTAYEFRTGANVQTVGFLRMREHRAGCSPDGLVGTPTAIERLVEIKCPRTARHLTYLRDGGIPSEHRAQLLHQLWVSGAPAVDFVSFDPLMPEALQLYIATLTADAAELVEYEKKAIAFLAEVDREYEAVLTMANPAATFAAAV